MMIEHVFPQVVGEIAPLRDVFRGQLIEHGQTPEYADALPRLPGGPGALGNNGGS